MPSQCPAAVCVSLSLAHGVGATVMREYDVIVLGAGPAGSIAAHQATLQGLSVLLVERSRFPREKACGGCLHGRAVELLGKMGLGPVLDMHGVPNGGRHGHLGHVRLRLRATVVSERRARARRAYEPGLLRGRFVSRSASSSSLR